MNLNLKQISFSEDDRKIIKWQLGCRDVRLGGIVERCTHGYPRIMLLDPVADGNNGRRVNYESISNLMWLTCPFLNDLIHVIESKGYITRLRDFINCDVAMRSKMTNSHASFYYMRKRIYREYFGQDIPDEDSDNFNSGIGGIRDIYSLKCLHIHFCYYRVCSDDIAGELTHRLMGEKIDCDGVTCGNAD
jgi:hypothetical protein